MNNQDYWDKFQAMKKIDSERDAIFDEIIDAWHVRYSLPEQLGRLKWAFKYPSMEFYNSVSAADRVLTANPFRVKVIPYEEDDANKRIANERERVLEWQFKNANRVRSTPIESDLARSALMFDCVAAVVIDLENELQIARKDGVDTRRLEAARRQTRFVVNTYSPRDVHVKRSYYGTEAVLLCLKRWASEVAVEHPNIAASLFPESNQDDYLLDYYRYWDFNVQAICIQSATSAEVIWAMEPKEHEMTFSPWVALMGGTTLESDEAHKYKSMGYAIVQGDLFNTHSSVRSMMFSEGQRTFAIARKVEEGMNPEYAEVNMGDDSIKMPPGNTMRILEPEGVNPYLAVLDEVVSRDIQEATVSNVIRGGQAPAGLAFETLNLLTLNAIGQLRPAKRRTEQALAEISVIMCLWAQKTGVSLFARGMEEKTDIGRLYSIPYDEIEQDKLYITVDMDTFSPTSDAQKANAALMKRQIGKYPVAYALEEVGVQDPERAIRQAELEMLIDAELQNIVEAQRAKLQLAIRQKEMEMELQHARAMAEAQAAAMQPPPEPEPVPGGMGWNPAAGGMSPVPAAPPEEVMREQVQGMTRGGMPLVGEEMEGMT